MHRAVCIHVNLCRCTCVSVHMHVYIYVLVVHVFVGIFVSVLHSKDNARHWAVLALSTECI